MTHEEQVNEIINKMSADDFNKWNEMDDQRSLEEQANEYVEMFKIMTPRPDVGENISEILPITLQTKCAIILVEKLIRFLNEIGNDLLWQTHEEQARNLTAVKAILEGRVK